MRPHGAGPLAARRDPTTHPDPPAALQRLAVDARPRQLTHFNDWANTVSFGKLERVTWKSDALEPDGIVAYPPDFSPSKKYPLVLLIHGGPTSSSKLSFSTLAQLMAAEGLL